MPGWAGRGVRRLLPLQLPLDVGEEEVADFGAGQAPGGGDNGALARGRHAYPMSRSRGIRAQSMLTTVSDALVVSNDQRAHHLKCKMATGVVIMTHQFTCC